MRGVTIHCFLRTPAGAMLTHTYGWVDFTEPGECISWRKVQCPDYPQPWKLTGPSKPTRNGGFPVSLGLYWLTSPIFIIDSIGNGFLLIQEDLSGVFFFFLTYEFLHYFLLKWKPTLVIRNPWAIQFGWYISINWLNTWGILVVHRERKDIKKKMASLVLKEKQLLPNSYIWKVSLLVEKKNISFPKIKF